MLGRPTTDELRRRRIQRADDEIRDLVTAAAPKAMKRVCDIVDDPNASDAAANSAAEKIMKELRRYQELDAEGSPEVSDEEKLEHMSDLAEPYIDLGLGAKH